MFDKDSYVSLLFLVNLSLNIPTYDNNYIQIIQILISYRIPQVHLSSNTLNTPRISLQKCLQKEHLYTALLLALPMLIR